MSRGYVIQLLADSLTGNVEGGEEGGVSGRGEEGGVRLRLPVAG